MFKRLTLENRSWILLVKKESMMSEAQKSLRITKQMTSFLWENHTLKHLISI